MKNPIFLLFTALLLVSCSNKSNVLTINPTSLESCDNPQVISLNWDVRPSFPEVDNVELFIGTGAKETLFGSFANFGKAETGKWVFPQAVFTIKDAVTHKVLNEVHVDI